MINFNVKFLTSDDTVQLKNFDFKSYKYETKKRAEETVFDAGKRSFCERRGGYWRAPGPRQIRQLESKLRDKTIITTMWTSDSLITIVFSSGAIAYLTVSLDTLDVTQILFDRYFVGKLSGQTVTNAVLSKSHILLTHADRMATLVTFGKNIHSLPYRIKDRDPNVQSIELGGGTRRTDRKLSWCEDTTGSRVLVWSVSAAEPAPWSPVLEDHANLHLYQITGHSMTLVAYHHLENETLAAELSENNDNIIHIVEQFSCQKNGVNLEWVRYEVGSERRATWLSHGRRSTTRAPLPAPARAVRRGPAARLLVSCIDGSLHVVHQAAGLTHTAKPGFIATEVHWVEELVVAAEEGGRVQCFDRALSVLHQYTKCLDLTPYLRDGRRMQILGTRGYRCGSVVLAHFVGGPLALLRITHPRILTAWIRARRTSNAVALLKALDWEKEGTECLWAVNRIVCAALRSGAECVCEESSAQSALGAYLAPRAPLPAPALRYAPPLHDLARKFFHHLLRRGRVEKALSLAVDLCAWDLFCDARWAAARRALPALAREAAALADHYAHNHHHAHDHSPESECSSCSRCSSRSYSESEDDRSASPEAAATKPPPLPRVSIPNPNHPTLMSVPITQAEPVPTTNSIRPNLHQYLERDNTIWNIDVRDDTLARNSGYDREHLKSILTQNGKWQSTEVLPNYKGSKHLLTINEVPKHNVIDIIPRPQDERVTTANFRHLYQTELREDVPNTLYRYQNNNNYHPAIKERGYRNDMNISERPVNRPGEKNKVKFSDTVTIAVVSEPAVTPEAARELADSLPLCAPHRYLAAFAPLPSPARPAPPTSAARPAPPASPAPPDGTPYDYVEV